MPIHPVPETHYEMSGSESDETTIQGTFHHCTVTAVIRNGEAHDLRTSRISDASPLEQIIGHHLLTAYVAVPVHRARLPL